MSERVLVIDSREQRYFHITAYFDSVRQRYVRTKLLCGDYTWLDNMTVCIDRKRGLQEVAGNLCQQHERFRAECVRAQENGIRLIVLVEDARAKALADVAAWKNPRAVRWEQLRKQHERGLALNVPLGAPPITGDRLAKAMQTMAERYGVEWRFCAPKDTGKAIIQILNEGSNAK